MEELLKFIVESLVDDKDAIQIEKHEDETAVVFEVRAAQQDTGKLIGKNGKIAQAIRSILHSASHKQSKKYILKIK